MTETMHLARSGWQPEEIDMLWQEIRAAGESGAPLRGVFERMGKALGRKPNSIRKQCGWDGISCLADPGSPEVNTDGIKRGFRGTQHHGGCPPHGRIHPIPGHQFRSHRQGCTAADGPDQHQ